MALGRRTLLKEAVKGLVISVPVLLALLTGGTVALAKNCQDVVYCNNVGCICEGNDLICHWSCFDSETLQYCWTIETRDVGACCPC